MNEDMLQMARKAGFSDHSNPEMWGYMTASVEELETFAALVRADEREACVEAVRKEWMDGSKPTFLRDLENAIRARSQE